MLQKSKRTSLAAGILLGLGIGSVGAEEFPLPAAGDDLIGRIRHTKAHQEDTLIDIARRFSVGQDEMMMANPTVDRWLPKEGTDVMIPQEYILPDAPRAGVVVNIPEMRLYYFPVKMAPVPVRKPAPVVNSKTGVKATAKTDAKTGGKPGAKVASGAKGAVVKPVVTKLATPKPEQVSLIGEPLVQSSEVITYPVSMGRMDWRTPVGKTTVVHKQKDPSWTPPASIKKEHAAKGDPLPDVVPPGPNNPLGKYAMRLGVAGYLIHGTDAPKSDGIGMRVTHGCMRLYNEDIEKLFPLVPVGSPVYLVNQPVKLGWKGDTLYMELSQPLDEDVGIHPHDVDDDVSKAELEREDRKRSSYLLRLANALIDKARANGDVSVNMNKVRRAIEKPTGLPFVIGGRGTGWESAAASDEGLAPVAKPKDVDEPAAVPARRSSPPRSQPSSTYDTGDLSASPVSDTPESVDYADTPPVRRAGVRSDPVEQSEPQEEEGGDTLYTPDQPYVPGKPSPARVSPYGMDTSGGSTEDIGEEE
jgi:lipoprotein-anchoring transpeptidase ErfK/SrfK